MTVPAEDNGSTSMHGTRTFGMRGVGHLYVSIYIHITVQIGML